MNERIKDIRKVLRLTQTAFAERIAVRQQTIAMIEAGKSNPSDQLINGICREFRVNETWLRTGEGEMFIPSPTSVVGKLADEYKLCPEAAAMVGKFVELEPSAQKAVFAYMCAVVDEIRGQSEPEPTGGMTDAEIAAAVHRGEDLEKEPAAQSEA